jgi:hypothetical protein
MLSHPMRLGWNIGAESKALTCIWVQTLASWRQHPRLVTPLSRLLVPHKQRALLNTKEPTLQRRVPRTPTNPPPHTQTSRLLAHTP